MCRGPNSAQTRRQILARYKSYNRLHRVATAIHALCTCCMPHWNKNALVTTNVTTNFSRVVLIYLVHRRRRAKSRIGGVPAKKKIRPFYLGKSPRSGDEKFQPQQPCPTIIPVWAVCNINGTYGRARGEACRPYLSTGYCNAQTPTCTSSLYCTL